MLALVAGIVVFAAPTFLYMARESWNSEQGGHGPIVLMTGLWLAYRLWPRAAAVAKAPPLHRVIALFCIFIPAYVVSRLTQIIEVEGYLAYACILTALYSILGGAGMRRMWFPLFYLAFMFPPPDTLVFTLTMPLKMALSQLAIALLRWFGLPIGGEGVTIFVGQYSLLVAAACSGLNSIIALAAISLFYIYVRHEAEWRYAVLLALLTVPVAMIANFVRVLCLILLTYYAGEAAAQGFLHNFAGLLMFSVAVISIFAIDVALKKIWDRFVASPDRAREARYAV